LVEKPSSAQSLRMAIFCVFRKHEKLRLTCLPKARFVFSEKYDPRFIKSVLRGEGFGFPRVYGRKDAAVKPTGMYSRRPAESQIRSLSYKNIPQRSKKIRPDPNFLRFLVRFIPFIAFTFLMPFYLKFLFNVKSNQSLSLHLQLRLRLRLRLRL